MGLAFGPEAKCAPVFAQDDIAHSEEIGSGKVRAAVARSRVSGSFPFALLRVRMTAENDCGLRLTASGDGREGEQGFLLVGVIVMLALVLLALSIAAPIVAKDLRRERELEAVHRAQQYTRAIRVYYKKNNAYPGSVKLLEGGKPLERYLRKHYLDPMTGKDDWRLIGVGQNKTTVKGFFGEPLAGIASQGLGSAAGLQSGGLQGSTGGSGSGSGIGSGSGSGSAFGNAAGGAGSAGAVGNGAVGQVGDQSGQSGSGSSFGSSSFGQSGTGSGATGSGGTGTGSGGSPLDGGSTGPFMGIGIPKEGASIVVLNEQTDYSKWEFLYDPRIEQLYAKTSIFGGGIASQSGGLGSASGLGSTPGSGSSGFGSSSFGNSGNGSGSNGGTSNGGSSGTGSGNTGTGGSTNPNAPTPQ